MGDYREGNPQFILPSLGKTACSGCPYGKARRCYGPTTVESYYVGDNSVIGCLDAHKQDKYYKTLLALSIPPQRARQENLFLPSFIPVITDALPQIPESGPIQTYAISMETLINKSGDLCVKSPEHLRKKLGLSLNARIALTGSAKDPKLERFWTNSTRPDVWRRIADLGFEFVTSCTFSIWYNHPRFDQIYNQQRNLLTHDFMSKLGVPSIPFLMFSNDKVDYAENISWLKDRSDVNIVALRGQFRKKEYEFQDLIDEMHSISADVPRPLHFLVVGTSEQHRITRILKEFSASIITAKPFMSAINWERASSNLDFYKVRSKQDGLMSLFEEEKEMSKEELVSHNIEQYQKYCDSFLFKKKSNVNKQKKRKQSLTIGK